MIVILLSGGSGKRLWPLSNEARSKQFLKILTSTGGQLESMVQRVWRQLAANEQINQVYISTNKSQVDIIQNQLGTDIPLIIEPERRDTFPAIALATAYLNSTIGADPHETILVMPVDPFVEDPFFDRLKEMQEIIERSGAELALMGVHPTYPSTKYGYILPQRDVTENQHKSNYFKVKEFNEKPTVEGAQQLINQQALWNCGVFAFKLGYMMDQLKMRDLPTKFEELMQNYEHLTKISFDYEIVEKAKDIVVLPYEGSWKDLGTWNTLTEEMKERRIGSGMISEDCNNSHLINELDIPVIVTGLSNIVVAASPDGIYVSDKSVSHQIKDIVKDIDRRPMYEERRWGSYRVLDYKELENGIKVLTKSIHISAHKNLSYQYHLMRSEVWVIVSGKGEFILEDQLLTVKAGDVLEIPVGAKHGIRAITPLEFIEVQMGTHLVEEDIVRLSMTWEETKKLLNDRN